MFSEKVVTSFEENKDCQESIDCRHRQAAMIFRRRLCWYEADFQICNHTLSMATINVTKRLHSPDHEEDDEDEFVGPMPAQQKPKKKKGMFSLLLWFSK